MKSIWASIFLSLGFCYPILTLSSSCQSIANRINNDINHRYPNNFQTKDLPWMKLNWLQKFLGQPEESDRTTDHTRYKWYCEGSGFLQVTVNAMGEVRRVSGQYFSNNGSGLFSTWIKKSRKNQSATENQLNQDFLPLQPQVKKDCDEIISDINSDIQAFKSFTQDQKLIWMDVVWLTQQIKPKPHITQDYHYAYHWNQFSLLLNADGSKQTYGIAPKINDTLEAANKEFGPAQKIDLEKVHQYSWHCPTARGSSLTAFVTEDKSITYLRGNACKIETCQPFATPLFKSKLQLNFALAAKKIENNSLEKISGNLRDYNEYFKSKLESSLDLQNDIQSRLQDFYSKLRTCQAGTYQYAIPVANQFLFNTSIIEKDKKDNRCQVNTSYQIPHIGAVTIKCLYRAQTLTLFTEQEANMLASGNNSFNSENPSKIQQVMDNECNRYINGVA